MKRLLTASLLVPAILLVVLRGPYWVFFGVTALVAVLCYREYCGVVSAYGVRGLGPLGYAGGLMLLAVNRNEFELLAILTLGTLAVSMLGNGLPTVLPRAAALVLGVTYIFGAWKFALLLRPYGTHWVAYALMMTWIGDACAYYVGRGIGRHKLAPRISPNKSWEGSAASAAGSVIFGAAYLHYFVPSAPWHHAVLLTLAANAVGQIGDLAESALKRGAKVKDSGQLLPGHGGMLDRVDSTLFTLPAVYLYTAWPL
ncbi:MAG: phosphatidate cytidylyltransferase [Bryobacterales bacterium]|nr:phosphatidate cytidylyltransferase [Bryobacterales bacterium]